MKTYEFVGKTTQLRTVARIVGTVQTIYDQLVDDEILHYDTIQSWILENKLSDVDNAVYRAYLDGEPVEEELIYDIDEKISFAQCDLTDDEMMSIISHNTSNMYYQEWHELDENGEY